MADIKKIISELQNLSEEEVDEVRTTLEVSAKSFKPAKVSIIKNRPSRRERIKKLQNSKFGIVLPAKGGSEKKLFLLQLLSNFLNVEKSEARDILLDSPTLLEIDTSYSDALGLLRNMHKFGLNAKMFIQSVPSDDNNDEVTRIHTDLIERALSELDSPRHHLAYLRVKLAEI